MTTPIVVSLTGGETTVVTNESAGGNIYTQAVLAMQAYKTEVEDRSSAYLKFQDNARANIINFLEGKIAALDIEVPASAPHAYGLEFLTPPLFPAVGSSTLTDDPEAWDIVSAKVGGTITSLATDDLIDSSGPFTGTGWATQAVYFRSGALKGQIFQVDVKLSDTALDLDTDIAAAGALVGDNFTVHQAIVYSPSVAWDPLEVLFGVFLNRYQLRWQFFIDARHESDIGLEVPSAGGDDRGEQIQLGIDLRTKERDNMTGRLTAYTEDNL